MKKTKKKVSKPRVIKHLKIIEICGKKVKIKVGDNFKDENGKTIGNGFYGWFDREKDTIYICASNHKTQKEFNKTLIHEICHAVFHYTGIRWAFEDGNNNVEEIVVRTIENTIISLWDDIRNIK